MPKTMLRYDAFLISCAVGGAGFAAFSFWQTGFFFDLRLLVFLVLLLQNSHYQVKNDQGSFSINFPLLFPVAAAFGPGWTVLMAAFGLISIDEFSDNSIPAFLYNRGALGLSAGMSSWLFHSAGGSSNLAPALFVAAASYSLVNLALFLTSRYLYRGSVGQALKYVWESGKLLLPSMALAALFYAVYVRFDIFGVIVGYYLFITLRSGFFLGHREINYRVGLIKALLRAVYAKDRDLMQHLENVAYYTKRLASECGYPKWKLAILDEASYLHDIGKLEINDSILKKPGSLTEGEWQEMRCHPLRGKAFLGEIPLPKAHKEIVENIVAYHHERYDGSGYPTGLQGDAIPVEARIVAIADAWDAMTTQRCYRPPMDISQALAELRRARGSQLDPKLTDIFIAMIEKEYAQKGAILAQPEINIKV